MDVSKENDTTREGIVKLRSRAYALMVSLMVASVLGVIEATPANAAATFTKKDFSWIGTNITGDPIGFNVVVNGRRECLDAANGESGMGAGAPQADVWGCGANNAILTWTITFKSDFKGFSIYNPATGGCLDDWGGQTSNGSPVKIYGIATVCNNASQTWAVWTNGSVDYIAPYTATFGGQVLSIAGTPHDGALVQMWRYGANTDQRIVNVGGLIY